MSKYDGPSFLRKDHSAIQPIKREKQAEEKQAKYKLPGNVRTQNDLKDEARQQMLNRKTPSHALPNDPPPERFPFKNKHIPTSLQNREGWQPQNTNTGLYAVIQSRLEKTESSYLLFEEHLSGEMKTKFEEQPVEEQSVEEQDVEVQSVEEKSVEEQPVVQEKSVVQEQPVVQEKVAAIKKATRKNMLNPGAGLHRSLSNIMAEEQRGIQKSQHKLNHLFNEKEKK